MTEVSKLEIYRTLSARDRDAIIRHDVRNLLAYTLLGASQLAKEGYMRRIRIPNFDFLGVGQMFALYMIGYLINYPEFVTTVMPSN